MSFPRVFRENVTSRRAAVDPEECLYDIAALLNDEVDDVSALNDRIEQHLRRLREVADLDISHLRTPVRGGFDDSAATKGVPQQGDLAIDLFIQKAIESGAENLYAMALQQMERELLIRVLRHTRQSASGGEGNRDCSGKSADKNSFARHRHRAKCTVRR